MFYLRADIRRPLHLVRAGVFTADRPWSHRARTIDDIEVIVGLRGTVYLRQDDERYTVGEGDVLVLLPGRVHEGYAESPAGTAFYWMHFTCDDDFAVLDAREAEEDLRLAGNNPYFDGLRDQVLTPDSFRAEKCRPARNPVPPAHHIIRSGYIPKLGAEYALTSLLIELTQQAAVRFGQARRVPRENMSRILEWIRAHITRNLSLRDVAHEFNYSREYLARYFKKNMGMCMQEYINKLKLARAREMLCQSGRPVREIAAALGFHDEKYFLKLFKRYQDITPSEFRGDQPTHMTQLAGRYPVRVRLPMPNRQGICRML